MEGEIGANDSDAEVTDEQERRGDRLQVEQCFHGLLHSIGVRAFAQGEVKGSELLTIPQGKSLTTCQSWTGRERVHDERLTRLKR